MVGKANLAAAALFAEDRLRLQQRAFSALVDRDDRGSLAQYLARSRASAGSESCELRLLVRGSRIPAKLTSQRCLNGERLIQTTIIDLRERENELDQMRHLIAAERRAREESEAKDQFIAMLSHELRTPLTPVLAATSAYAERSGVPPELRQIFAMIRRNVTAEARLIDDLLDLTGIVRRKLQVKCEPLDVHQVVLEAVEILNPQIAGGGRTVKLDLAATGHHVLGDSLRLRQVFWNLLHNALKYTRLGGKINVASWDHHGRVRIEVADDGLGFDPAAVERLFQPFERAHEERQGSSGLGLGLAISKGLVELQNGAILAHSAGVGRGSLFVVELPTSAEAVRPVATQQSASLPSARAASRRVLLIEDHQDTVEMMTELLQTQGYEVLPADSASKARRTDPASFDLIVSDIGLPDGTGLELIKELQHGGHKPAIALSGYGTQADVQASKDAGFDLHLTKPVDMLQLLDAIRSLSA